MELKILKNPDVRLTERATVLVDSITLELFNIASSMLSIMTDNKISTLSANQVGRKERIIVCNFEKAYKMFNPVILKKSSKMTVKKETCVSCSNENSITRSKEITLRYLNEYGRIKTVEFRGDEARSVQHGIDHLDGILPSNYSE